MIVTKWLLIIIVAIVVFAILAVFCGQARDTSRVEQLLQQLLANTREATLARVDFTAFAELPAPVARYFRHVLTDDQPLINVANMQQAGVLRTSTASESWAPFTANQLVVPSAPGFVWNARVKMPFATHVRVIDSYINAVGAGRVSLLSAVTVASAAGDKELNSGALHRYLAEGVWFPTALLPQSGVMWSPIDENTALATLTDKGTTVSLEFRFNDLGEVTAIYSDGRFGRFNGEYKQVPWQGHFRDYQIQDGMRIPRYGEVGWYDNEILQLVWQGELVSVQYQFER